MLALTDASPMPWGKYAGRPMEQVPASYLDHMHDVLANATGRLSKSRAAVLNYIVRNRSLIDAELEASGDLA